MFELIFLPLIPTGDPLPGRFAAPSGHNPKVSLKVRIFLQDKGPRQPVFMVFLAAMQGFYWFLLQ